MSDGNWFARIKIGNRLAAFCKPWCVERFLDDRDSYSNRIEFQTKALQAGAIQATSADGTSPGFAAAQQEMASNWQVKASAGTSAI